MEPYATRVVKGECIYITGSYAILVLCTHTRRPVTSPIAGGLFPISKLDIHTILLFILTFLYFYIFYNEIFSFVSEDIR